MSSLSLRVQKHLPIETGMGAVATLRQITDESGKPPDFRRPLDVVIPANNQGDGHTVNISPGLWVVEATLPSGELITTQVDVAAGKDLSVVLQASEQSPREWLGWQYLLGNIEGEATLELLQQRARKMAARLAREALGKSADPQFVERIAESTARVVTYLWRWIVTPFAAALRFVTNGKFPLETAVAKKPVAAETEDATVRLFTADTLRGGDADPWIALFSNDPAGPSHSATRVAADIATSVYDFKWPLPLHLDQPLELQPREFVSVVWRNERYVIALPLPWPALDGGMGVAAQIMVRRRPIEGRLQIGVAVLDGIFGPLSGFMTPGTLSKAAVVVDQAYDMLFDKTRNPLAAAAAGYILIAAGDTAERDWHEWVGNLERLFPGLPDGAVLRGSLLLRHARDQAELYQAREAFLHAYDRGIPYFSIGVSWLLDGLMLFSGDPEVDDKLANVERVARRLDLSQAFTVMRLGNRQGSHNQQRTSSEASQSTPVADQNGDSTAMTDIPSDIVPTTFSTIEMQPEATASLNLTEFVNTLLVKLRTLKDERFAYYEKLRQENSGWANKSRRWLALLGSLAFLLTALAATLRFTAWFGESDKGALVAVLLIYAIMGTISFYEKGTTKTSDYFRHLSVILSIRDLWTKLQFALLEEVMTLKRADDKVAAEPATRARIVALAEAFCNDLNKVSTSELADWRTAFMASLTELSDAAKKGSDDVVKQLQDATKAAEKAATDAKAAAETAAKAAAEVGKPGSINITISGEFDGEVVVSVDGVERARSNGKSVAIESIPPGIRKFSAQAQKGAKKLEASQMVEVKPGLQNLVLALT
jgi:hypothetical protein